MVSQYNIYLAGDMKSGWQDDVMMHMKRIDRALKFFDPRTHGLDDEQEYTEWDLSRVRRSDIVFCVLSPTNPAGQGMALEVGFAKALGKLIIWVEDEEYPHPKARYFGMCRACADKRFDNIRDAVLWLEGWMDGDFK